MRPRVRARARPPRTHVLCLPVVNSITRPQLEPKLAAFQYDASLFVDEKSIRPIESLHIALGVMHFNKPRLDFATKILRSLDLSAMLRESWVASPQANSVVQGQLTSPLKIKLKGIRSMYYAENTSHLYIPPRDDSRRLSSFCLALRRAFEDRGLLKDDDRLFHDKFMPHVTIVNTRYSDDTSRDRKLFNPQFLLDKYGTYEWTEQTLVLDRVSICQMGVQVHEDDTFGLVYKEACHALLPSEHDQRIGETENTQENDKGQVDEIVQEHDKW